MATRKEKVETDDDKTLKLIDEVRRRKIEIAKLGKQIPWNTNCSFSYSVDGAAPRINLHTAQDVRQLVLIAGFLWEKHNSYNQMIAQLTLETRVEFEWQGFSYADWVADINSRISQLELSTKKAKLEALEKRLQAVISPELRRKMELEEIAADLT